MIAVAGLTRRERSFLYLKDVKRWGSWGGLLAAPVKRTRDGEVKLGIVFALKGAREAYPVVYLINVFAISREALQRADKWEYEDVESLVNDGWVID